MKRYSNYRTRVTTAWVFVAIMARSAIPATAGFIQTGAGPWDYNTTGNWAGDTIDGLWDASLSLTAGQTVTFASDTALSTGLTFNYAGNFALGLKAAAAGTQTLTLGGDVGLNTSGGTTANVTLGDSANHLNVDLGGAPRTVTVASGRSLTLYDTVSGGGVLKSGSGSLILRGTNTYSGGTTLNGGTLTLYNNSAIGTGALTIGAGTTIGTYYGGASIVLPNMPIVLNGSFTHPDTIKHFNFGTGAVTLNTNITITTTHQVTLGGVISGPGGLNALDIAANGGNDSGVIFSQPITLRTNQTATTQNGSAFLVAAGGIVDGGNLYGVTVSGPGWLFLNGSNSFAGPLTINGGARAALGWNGATGSLSTNTPIVDNGTLQFYRNNSVTQGVDFCSTISGTGGVVQASGTTTLNGANTYSGVTTISGGTLVFTSIDGAGVASAVGACTAAGAGGIALNGGTCRYTGGAVSVNRGFTMGGSATFDVSPSNTVLTLGSCAMGGYTLGVTGGAGSGLTLGGVVLTGSPTLNPTSAGLTFSGAVSGGYGLTKSGNGTLSLSGTNTFTGGTTLTAGTLNINGDASLGAPHGTLTLNGGTLQFAAGSAVTLGASRSVVLASGTTSLADTSLASGAIAGVISGSGSLTKSGSNALTLMGTNTYTGITRVNGGTLSPGNSKALQFSCYDTTGSTNGIGLDATLVAAPILGGLRGGIDLGTAITAYAGVTGLTLNPQSGAVTYSGVISDGAAGMTLAKTGGGMQVLTGTNTYTGTTTVNGGILRINGSTPASSAVDVTGGAIGGTGTLGGSVTLSGNGGVDLRDGVVGTLTIGGNLAINGAAGANRFYFDLSSGGTTTDRILVNGSVTMGTPGAAVLCLNPLGSRIQTGLYALIQGSSMPSSNDFSLATTAAYGMTFSLGGGSTGIQVTAVQAMSGPSAAWWSGASDGYWSSVGNWNSDASSGVTAGGAPGYQSDVNFYTTTPAAGNLSTILDADFDIKSLIFTETVIAPVSIGGTKTLTIEGASGITARTPSSGTVTNTITANVALAASQTWAVSNNATLVVSGNVTDLSGGTNSLTKGGAGLLRLSGATRVGNLYVGYNTAATIGNLEVSGGTLSVGVGPANNLYIGWGSSSAANGAGTLDAAGASSVMVNVGNVMVGGTVGGVGVMNLGASNTITAATQFGISKGSWGFPNGYGTVTSATGSSTAIHTPLMYVGYNLPNGTTGGWGKFLLGTNASLTLDGPGGTRSALYVGVIGGGNGAGENSPSLLDLTGGGNGVATLSLSSLLIGQRQGGNANAYGIMTLSGNASNHLEVSGSGNVVLIGDSLSSGITEGTLSAGNLDASSTIVSTDNSTAILLGSKRSSGTTVGRLNLLGGTLTIATTGSAIAGGGGTSMLNLNNGMTLKPGASSTNWITGLQSATITNGAVFDTAGYDVAVPQAFSGPGGLTKTGAGALLLTGTNSFSGPLTVTAGTLGGLYGSSGGGALTNRATLSPGNSVGTFRHSGNVVLESGSTLVLEVSGPTNDVLAVGGTLTMGGTLTIVTNGVPAAPTFVLVTAAGGLTGSFSATNGLPPGGTLTYEANRIVFNPPATGAPAVTNTGATVTGVGTATLSGRYLDANAGSVTFCWGTADGGTGLPSAWQHNTNIGVQVTASFSANIGGLLYPQTYVYRIYATNAIGGGWSDPFTAFMATSKPGVGLLRVTNGLALWLDASATNTFTLAGSTVNEWQDKMGSGAKATLRGGAPAWTASGIGNVPTVRFNNSAWMNDGVNHSAPVTVLMVARQYGGSNQRVLGASANNWLFGYHGGTRNDFYFNGWVNDSGTASDTNAHLHAATIPGAGQNSTVYAEGAQIASNQNGIQGPNNLQLNGYNNSASELSNCDISEVLLYSRVLDGAELNRAGAYLSAKYGLITAYTNDSTGDDISIVNLGATNVTDVTGWMNGRVSCPGAVYDVWAFWGPTDGGTSAEAWTNRTHVGSFTDGVFSVSSHATGLSSNSTAWYTFMASNALDQIWAAPSTNFVTVSAAPAVTNTGSVTGNGFATLRGELTQGNVADVYVYWGRTNEGQTANWEHVQLLPATPQGAFETTISAGFNPSGYFYTCFASNVLGTAWASPSSNFYVNPNATDFFWVNTNGGPWSVGVNWTNVQAATGPATAGQTNYTLNFNEAGAYASTHDLDSGFIVNRLNFGGPDLALSGNSLALTANGPIPPQVCQNSSGAVAIANAIVLGGAMYFSGTDVGAVSVSGAISGSGSLIKTSPGPLTLTGANGFSGAMIVSNGEAIAQDAAFAAVSRTYSVASNGVLTLAGAAGIAPGTTTITGDGTLRIASGATTSAGGGANVLNMSMAPGGMIDLAAGSLLFNGGWQAINWSNNKASMTVDGTLNIWDGQETVVDGLNGSGSVENGHGGVTGKGLTVGVSGGSGTFDGVFSSSAAPRSLTKNGSGTQVLTGVNTYSGNTYINGGTLEIRGSGQLGAGNYAGAISNAGLLYISSSADQVLGGAISGTGSVVKAGGGILTLGGASTYSGPTIISNGWLIVTNTSLSGTGAGAVTCRTGTGLGGKGTIAGPVQLEAGTTLMPGNTNALGTLTLSAPGLNLGFGDGATLNYTIGGTDQQPTSSMVNLSGADSTITFGSTATLRLFRATGATINHPMISHDFVLFQYGAAAPPAMPAWTIDYGDTGWSSASLAVNAANRQIVLRFRHPAILMIR